MLINFLKTGWRNIWRNKTFSFINIFGLAVSMSLGLLIILIIREQYSYDTFQIDKDRIYRVNTTALRTNGNAENYASAPLPIAKELKENFDIADDVVRINRQLNGNITYGDVTVPAFGFFTDPSFLHFFNFPLKKGNPQTALSSPNGIVLSEQVAERLFGKVDPMGKSITIQGYGLYIVTGLMDKFPGKTHLEFEILAPFASIPIAEREAAIESWSNYYSGYIYLKLNKDKNPAELEKALAQIHKKNVAGRKFETRDKDYQFYIQPLSKITPGPNLSNQMGRALPKIVSDYLALLAIIIMIMAGLNYTNLMIAKSLNRAKEIGVRKVMGANKKQVFFQFIGESILLSVIALLFAYLLLQYLKPAFLQFNMANEFALQLKESWQDYILFFCFALLVGFIAGLVPAGFLSGFKPIAVLKDKIGSKGRKKFNYRKILIVTQFTVSLVFVVMILILNKQLNFVMNADYGFNQANILNLRLQGNDPIKLATAIESIPGVKQTGLVSHSLGTWSDRSSDYKKIAGDEPFVIRDFIADKKYIENLELKFVAGKNFSSVSPMDFRNEIILNEEALSYFEFPDPSSAIGETVYVSDSVQLTVTGVVKNFHYRPLTYAIGPLAFRNDIQEFSILSISITPGMQDNITAAIEPIWKSIDPVNMLNIELMNNELDDAYVQGGFADIIKILGYISLLAIMLACMGMLGIVMFSTKTREKEIGIRKILGATVKNISFHLGWSYIKLIIISILIGLPISYILSYKFLETFAIKATGLGWAITGGVFIIFLLSLLTIFSQIFKTATSNPVKNLRTE